MKLDLFGLEPTTRTHRVCDPRLPTLAEPGGAARWACFSSAPRKRYDAYVSRGNLEALASRASNLAGEPRHHDLASPPSADSRRPLPRPPR